MASSVSETLRLTNGRVRELIHRMQTTEGRDALVKQQDFDALLGEVTRAAVWLQRVSPLSVSDEGLAKEISEYRGSLEQLRHMFPAIHRRLLAEESTPGGHAPPSDGGHRLGKRFSAYALAWCWNPGAFVET